MKEKAKQFQSLNLELQFFIRAMQSRLPILIYK